MTVSQIKPGHDAWRRFRACVRACVRASSRACALPATWTRLSGLAALAAVATLAGGLAAPRAALADYRVRIEAPKGLEKLLETNLDLARYAGRDDIGDAQFEHLIATVGEQVQELTSTEGYFTPVTHVDVATINGKRDVRVTVESGPRTHIKDVDLKFTGPVAESDPQRVAQLRHAWELPVDAPFRQADWDKAKNDTLFQLGQKRYHAARMTFSRAVVDADREAASLAATYDSGPPFTLGPLVITGTRRYPAQIIRNVNPLSEGEAFDADRLQELQRQIQATPYFSNVIISVTEDPSKAENAPVEVKVREFPEHRVQSGVGYTTDTGASVNGRYSYYNLFGRAWTFDTQARLEQYRQGGYAEIAMPPDTSAYTNSLRGSFDRTYLNGLDQRSAQVGVKRARSRERYDWAYTLDLYRTDERPDGGARFLNKALVPAFSWNRRDVDDLIFPRKGNIINTQIGFAAKPVLTDQSFVRLYGRIRQYFPVAERDLVLARLELGAVLTNGNSNRIPSSLLFFAGGTSSIRGYTYQSIGRQQNGTTYPTKYLGTASLEYQRWVTRDWGGAVFWDVGTATDDYRRPTPLYHGVGVGLRWRSPVGPVNVDLGYGVHDRRLRPAISLGVAF
ncbi:Translocation and assembly module TamA [Pandoraea nosoerga]|uniref:Translocation and assembly module TamA n=1 Tax=Pandoraea nosoerga TaxID=2508296 RepID=A0A5E4W651_9BURK|nr:autotransporter assembly complex family protein [Pandoraea nosoerga]VVE19339.1 Translocation and assembly module TamA [Pandoraea nosoerga]